MGDHISGGGEFDAFLNVFVFGGFSGGDLGFWGIPQDIAGINTASLLFFTLSSGQYADSRLSRIKLACVKPLLNQLIMQFTEMNDTTKQIHFPTCDNIHV